MSIVTYIARLTVLLASVLVAKNNLYFCGVGFINEVQAYNQPGTDPKSQVRKSGPPSHPRVYDPSVVDPDPGSGTFLTPGSTKSDPECGMNIPDYISGSLETILG